ncbi:hypothetical protein BDZ89DRAFT_1069337 [Hymenopellis radicata]|nr:hypothetical protein BDZ89DRAFT_1069337 [Hymenopellis radicata]
MSTVTEIFTPPLNPAPPENGITYKGKWLPHFAPPVDLSDHSAIVAYCEKLAADKRTALKEPLYPGWSFDATIDPHPLLNDYRGRRRIVEPLRITAAKGFRFVLDRALQPYVPEHLRPEKGEPQWSQVWRAEIRNARDEALAAVAVKIIQPSLLPHPSSRTPVDKRLVQYAFSDDVANAEHVLYRQAMAHLQGRVVPYYYGKTKIRMPNGEEAHVLILEGIPGQTLATWVENFKASNDQATLIERLPDLTQEVLKSYNILRESGILHRDIDLANMILVEGRIVLIDFAESALNVSQERQREERQLYRAASGLPVYCRDSYTGFDKWATNTEAGRGLIARLGWQKMIYGSTDADSDASDDSESE